MNKITVKKIIAYLKDKKSENFVNSDVVLLLFIFVGYNVLYQHILIIITLERQTK